MSGSQPKGRMAVELKHPVTVAGETVDKLEFRRPKGKDFRGIVIDIGNGGMRIPTDDILRLGGRLCGQPDVVMDEIDIADLTEVVTTVLGFIESSQTTGKTPSQP